MGYVMKAETFVKKAKDIANNYKTLYVLGCFGAPMTASNKKRYTSNYSYNAQATRKRMIMNASSDTFGFDCVCLIKGILWGWNGNKNAVYGGAKYCSNGVPDFGSDGIMNYCTGVTTNFSNIVPGEVVHMKGHVGIYIGDGLVVECSPAWKNKVQITACGNIGSRSGYNTRTWVNHGRLKYIEYSNTPTPSPTPSGFLPAKGYFKKGDSGNNVKKICDFFANKVKGDYFGDYTETCTKTFQRIEGIETDGCIGPITAGRMKLKLTFPKRGYFKKGDSGSSVTKIDDFLKKKVEGNYYGEYCESCVKLFQRLNGLEQDGCIGPITLKKMEQNGFKH